MILQEILQQALTGKSKKQRDIASKKEDVEKSRLIALQRDAEVQAQLAGLKGIREDARLKAETAQFDYDRQKTAQDVARLDAEEEFKQFQLRSDTQKAKLGSLVGEDALKAYEAGSESRKEYLDQLAKTDQRKAAIVKEAWDKFDGDTAISSIVEKFKMPIRMVQEMYTGFRKALGDPEAASSAMETFFERKFGKEQEKLGATKQFLGQ